MNSELASIARKGSAPGEEQFLDALLSFTRSARGSKVPEVAMAARKWEGVIRFRIRITLQERDRYARRRTIRKERFNAGR